jgi:hypothetical protein
VSDDGSRCLVCGGPPAEFFCSLPPARRVVKYGNGGVEPYTLCTTCLALPDACERVDAALRRRAEGGTDDA